MPYKQLLMRQISLENLSIGANMRLMSHNMYRRLDKITSLTISFYHLIFSFAQTLNNSLIVLHAMGKLRRLGLVHLRKEYVRRQLMDRQGDCVQCGACCNLLLTCPLLTKQYRCLVYNSCRPQACKVFPIDQQDIDEIKLCGVKCGYRFK